MRINCESLRINRKSDSPFVGEGQKMINHVLFLNLAVHTHKHTHLLTHLH